MFYANDKYYTKADITKVLGVPVRGKGGFETTTVVAEEQMPEMPMMMEHPIVGIPSKPAHGGQQKKMMNGDMDGTMKKEKMAGGKGMMEKGK